MSDIHKQVWLITGASSGLGKSLAMEALEKGHTVLGTTRDIKKAQQAFPEFEQNGGLWFALDPGSVDAYDQASKISKAHDVDVLVNNAGFAFIGGVEDTRYDLLKTQMYSDWCSDLIGTVRTRCAHKWKSTSTVPFASFEHSFPACVRRNQEALY
jgi:short-subunit dehydrogenase